MLGRRLISAAILVLCLLVPPAAGAAEEDEGAIHVFRLKASNGYRVLVIASRQPGKTRGQLAILVGSRHAGGVVYTASASVEETGVRADLGELGRIELEYVRLKGKERYSGCGSDGEVHYLERGEYRGLFELHGEEGYTEARATRLRGDERILLSLICGEIVGFGDATGPGLPGARLHAFLRQGKDNALSFEIKKNRPAAPAAFAVSVRERRGEVRIERQLEGTVGAGGFRYDPRLRGATVSPPAPFAGSATFRREAPRRNRWTGDLTIDLPGRSDTPLVQPGLRLSLVHASWSKTRGRVARPAAFGRPLALLEAP